jgi:hypothetical protein
MSTSLALFLALCVGQAAAPSPFVFREISPTGLELSDGGKPVFVYNFGMVLAPGFPESMRRSSYLHPVYAPDGTVLTDDFNKGHPHHRGISWVWPDITVDGKKGDIWTVKGFQQRFVAWKARGIETKSIGPIPRKGYNEMQFFPPVARLAVENGWFDGQRKFVKEDVEILTHPAKDGRRLLEFTLRFEAVDRPVQVVGTSEVEHVGKTEVKKGFGGFCFRFAPRDGGIKATVIRTDQGIMAKDGILSPHPWAEISGTFQGKPAGARVEDMPSNPGYPKNGWLMRHGFGFLNVSYPGLETITLEPGKPLVLKYRVILFAGPPPGAPDGGR